MCTLTWSYILCKKKFCNGGSHPALSSLKKELWDEHLHSPPKGSRVSSSSAVESDSLLLPFLYNPQPEIVRPLIEGSSLGSDSPDSNLERYDQIVFLFGFQIRYLILSILIGSASDLVG